MVETTGARRFGIALLGLVIGALAGFILHEIVGVIMLSVIGSVDSIGLSMLLAYLTPATAIAGLLIALRIDTVRRRGGSR